MLSTPSVPFSFFPPLLPWRLDRVQVLIQAIDYKQLYRRLEDPPCESRARRPTLFESDCHGNHPISLSRLAKLSWGVNSLLFLFLLVWSWFFTVFLRKIPSIAAIRDFYAEELKISHERLQTIRWDRVCLFFVGVVVQAPKSIVPAQLCPRVGTH